jgi:hypothetical protein
MDRIMAVLSYWREAPPVNELVLNFFERNSFDGAGDDLTGYFPEGDIR